MCDGIWMQEHVNTPEMPTNTITDKGNAETLKELKTLLDFIYKTFEKVNEDYGESSLNPLSLFSRQDSVDVLCLRVDYKIGKIKELGIQNPKDPNLVELTELLLLLSVALKRKGAY